MEEYGYINADGYLVSKFLEPMEVKYKDDDETVRTRTVSIAEQLEEMGDIWKPVDRVDDAQLVSEDPFYTVQIIPYDAGERISYRYERIPDNKYINETINALKNQLEADDYKIIKCYESSLSGEALPYDGAELHNKRQSIRDQINELEAKQIRLNSL